MQEVKKKMRREEEDGGPVTGLKLSPAAGWCCPEDSSDATVKDQQQQQQQQQRRQKRGAGRPKLDETERKGRGELHTDRYLQQQPKRCDTESQGEVKEVLLGSSNKLKHQNTVKNRSEDGAALRRLREHVSAKAREKEYYSIREWDVADLTAADALNKIGNGDDVFLRLRLRKAAEERGDKMFVSLNGEKIRW